MKDYTMSDKEILLLAYGAMKANLTSYTKETTKVVEIVERHLFGPPIIVVPTPNALEPVK